MKKIAILSIAFAGLAFASCKKDRTCECTTTITEVDGGTTTTTNIPTQTIEIKEIKGSEAKSWCQKETVVQTYGTTTETTVRDCKLK